MPVLSQSQQYLVVAQQRHSAIVLIMLGTLGFVLQSACKVCQKTPLQHRDLLTGLLSTKFYEISRKLQYLKPRRVSNTVVIH